MAKKLILLAVFIATCATGLLLMFYCTWCLVVVSLEHDVAAFDSSPHELETRAGSTNYYEFTTPEGTYHFNLVAPAAAPKEIHNKVMLGYRIMCETGRYAKEYVGNSLRCINCHFLGGNTLGGRNGAISLVGVSSWYPAYSERSKTTINLADRLDNCFMRSLNGKAPPPDSPEMESLIAYLGWISKDVANIKDPPWRGLKELKSQKQPNTVKGAILYQQKCATCHGANGEGISKNHNTLQIPPVWGPHSFNDGAGMHRLDLLSSFIYYNMPYENPSLNEYEAIDIAGFIRLQKRPHFIPPGAK